MEKQKELLDKLDWIFASVYNLKELINHDDFYNGESYGDVWNDLNTIQRRTKNAKDYLENNFKID